MRMSSLPNCESATVFRFGEFEFDTASHLLLRHGSKLHLSRKGMRLLHMLLVNRPRVVTRQEIYDTLWPETYVRETNMACIVRELRRVLGDDARSAQYIRTVHGSGYAFTGDVQTNDSEPTAAAILLCEGTSHLLYEGENTIGRSGDCSVLLNDAMVSRQHAVIVISETTIFLEDRGSKNGTYVRDQKIARTEVRYHEPIRFGTVQAVIKPIGSSSMPTPWNVPRPYLQNDDIKTR